jgi:lipoprotein-anchoring transpeptidase ErfK/SrfK
MFRLRLLAVACVSSLAILPAQSEALKVVSEPAPTATVEAAAATSADAIKAADQKLEQAAATATDTTAAPAPSQAAPAPSAATSAADAAKAAEPAKAAPAPLPSPTMTVGIDLAAQRLTVSEHGVAKYTWPISSGTSEFPTPRGTFRPQWTAKMWYSRKYDNAPMPHAVFINGGVAVHATYHTGALGRPASHGCIRLSPSNAKTFYSLVHKHGLKATKVSVYGTPKWGKGPAIASRTLRAKRYAAVQQQNDSWNWGGPSYNTTSAYDQGFAAKRYRKPPNRYGYGKLPSQLPRVIYRGGQKYVYVQRPRKVYYYNNSGYGYGGGW